MHSWKNSICLIVSIRGWSQKQKSAGGHHSSWCGVGVWRAACLSLILLKTCTIFQRTLLHPFLIEHTLPTYLSMTWRRTRKKKTVHREEKHTLLWWKQCYITFCLEPLKAWVHSYLTSVSHNHPASHFDELSAYKLRQAWFTNVWLQKQKGWRKQTVFLCSFNSRNEVRSEFWTFSIHILWSSRLCNRSKIV